MSKMNWFLIAIVALAVILALMNLHAYERKKNYQTKMDENGRTKPPMENGSGELDQLPQSPIAEMPTSSGPSAEMEDMFSEDYAAGDTSWNNTGDQTLEGLY